MDFKRIFRGPLIWIIVGRRPRRSSACSCSTASNFREITTQEGLALLDGDTVDKAKIVDGEQRVDLTLDARRPTRTSARPCSSTTSRSAATM